MISVLVDEPNNGPWFAELVTLEEPSGSFTLAGEQWSGHVTSVTFDGARYRSLIVGGNGGLNVVVSSIQHKTERFGNLFRRICDIAGERVGSVPSSFSATDYFRASEPAGAALSRLCKTFGFIWWVGRDGTINAAPRREHTATASGQETANTTTGATLTNPENVFVGGTYKERVIQSLRWVVSSEREEVHLDFLEKNNLGRFNYSAAHASQNTTILGDSANVRIGTADMTKVPVYSSDGVVIFSNGDPRVPVLISPTKGTILLAQAVISPPFPVTPVGFFRDDPIGKAQLAAAIATVTNSGSVPIMLEIGP